MENININSMAVSSTTATINIPPFLQHLQFHSPPAVYYYYFVSLFFFKEKCACIEMSTNNSSLTSQQCLLATYSSSQAQ